MTTVELVCFFGPPMALGLYGLFYFARNKLRTYDFVVTELRECTMYAGYRVYSAYCRKTGVQVKGSTCLHQNATVEQFTEVLNVAKGKIPEY